MASTTPFLVRAKLDDDAPAEGFPFELAAVQQIAALAFAPVTVLTGDNGTGKSTVVEAIAVAAGFNAEGGGKNLRFETHRTHSDLHDHLVLQWDRRPRWGWFLRAETFYGMASHVASDGDLAGTFPDLHGQSHGESFLNLALSRFESPGLYILDEPEAALSIQGQMVLARLVFDAIAIGAQFVIATHSPFLMAFPDAAVYELTGDGIEAVDFDDLTSTVLWRRFLDEPASLYRRLLTDPDPSE